MWLPTLIQSLVPYYFEMKTNYEYTHQTELFDTHFI